MPTKFNLTCSQCFIRNGIILDLCADCELKSNIYDYDEEYYSEQQDKEIIKQIKQHVSQQINEFDKVIKMNTQKKKPLKTSYRSRYIPYQSNLSKIYPKDSEYQNMTQKQYEEQELLDQFLENCEKPHLKKFVRNYKDDFDTRKIRRGPNNLPQIDHLRIYKKPRGYIGIPLQVQVGKWLSKDGNSDQWLIAYHGTTLKAVKNIIDYGFLIGPRQQHISQLSVNSLTLDQKIKKGIYCTPDCYTALNYSTISARGLRYVLQCRVNPKALKVCKNGYWVINKPEDIKPYRLLVKI